MLFFIKNEKILTSLWNIDFAKRAVIIPVSYFVPEITKNISTLLKIIFKMVYIIVLKNGNCARALPPVSHCRNRGSIPDESIWKM